MTGEPFGGGSIWLGIICAAIALFSLTIVIWPRWYIWLDTVFRFEEQPEPRAWYLDYTRMTGLIPLLIFGIASIFFFTAPARDASADAERRANAERVAAVCSELQPLLAAAADITPRSLDDSGTVPRSRDGSVDNPDELEAIIIEHGAAVDWEMSFPDSLNTRSTISGMVSDPETTLTFLTIATSPGVGADDGYVWGDCSVDSLEKRLERVERERARR